MPSCAIITCRARSQVSSVAKGNVSFHRFPKDPDIVNKWIDATGRDKWFQTKFSTICSKHFTQNDYTLKKSGYKYLKYGAVPHERVVKVHSVTTDTKSPYSSPLKLTPNEDKEEKEDQEIMKQAKEEGIVNQLPSTSSTILIKGSPRKRSQTPCNSSNTSTPRKKKLKQIISTKDSVIKRQRKVIKKIQAQNRRLKKKIYKMEDLINDLQQKFSMRHEDLSILKNSNLQVEELFSRYLSKDHSGGVIKEKYSQALRTFALTLHYYSPKAYNYVRDTFRTCLPHVRTLRKWYSSVNGEAGFTSESFAALTVKSQCTKYTVIAGLVIDEMAIKRRIEWDGMKLHGHVEIDSGVEGDYVTEAKEALVFLVTGINCNFKVPVAYFLVDGVTGVRRP